MRTRSTRRAARRVTVPSTDVRRGRPCARGRAAGTSPATRAPRRRDRPGRPIVVIVTSVGSPVDLVVGDEPVDAVDRLARREPVEGRRAPARRSAARSAGRPRRAQPSAPGGLTGRRCGRSTRARGARPGSRRARGCVGGRDGRAGAPATVDRVPDEQPASSTTRREQRRRPRTARRGAVGARAGRVGPELRCGRPGRSACG